MIKICDAIMGSGKSQAAIAYMNANPDKRFVYITPYLPEAKRIKDGCPSLHFVEPSKKLGEYNWSKIRHTTALLEEGRNITSTHQAFLGYGDDTLEIIRRMGYTLIIDENINTLQKKDDITDGDIRLLVESGHVQAFDDHCELIKDMEYNTKYDKLISIMRGRDLIRIDNKKKNGRYFYWNMPADFVTAFDDVIVLTYMFETGGLYCTFEMNNVEYKKIGVERTEDGGFFFSDGGGYIPNYVKTLRDKIHVLDSAKLNYVGKNDNALSMSWFKKKANRDKVEQLRKNINNFFRNICSDSTVYDRMWGTYGSNDDSDIEDDESPTTAKFMLRGKGYTNEHVAWNARATNEYRHKKYLAYCVNIFMNVGEKDFYRKHGVEIDEDAYALSTMIQWIWRSAIRDGKEIWIYIPSRRMRTLLINWMDSLAEGTENTFEEGGETDAM